MKRVAAVLLCLFVSPLFAKEAVFANGVLTFDSVQVGADTYEVKLAPVPNAVPLAFTVTQARKVASASPHAATFVGTTLTVPNVLVNGTMRVRASLILTGQNPYKFQLSSYSVLRSINLDNLGQTLTPGRVFNVKYTGGVLASDKVKLSIGATQLQASVLGNVVASVVPAGLSGSQTLTVELDGDSFQLPLTIVAGADIANPKPYILGYINEVAADLKGLGLSSSLLDTTTITSQLATLSEADAKFAALQIRENLEPLLAQVNVLLGSGAMLDVSSYALSATSRDDCERWGKRFAEAHYLTSRAFGLASKGLSAGLSIPGAIVAGVGLAGMAIGAEVAVRNMVLIETNCIVLYDATFTLLPLLEGNIVLSKPVEVFESRARSFQLNELFKLDSSVSKTYEPLAVELKANLVIAIVVARELGLSSSNSAVSVLTTLAAAIKAGGNSTLSTDGHKFSVRTISDADISGSTVNTGAGSLTLLFDKKSADIAEGKKVTFTIQLYNSADGISITVPVNLNGASLLEDLKQAVVGNWTVENVQNKTVYPLELKAGGTGVYKLKTTETSCANTGPPVNGFCEYKTTWSISKVGTKYVLYDYGFWHPGYNDPVLGDRSGLALPVTGFTTYEIGNPANVSIRYTKL